MERSRGATWSAVAALTSVIAASSCCLPVLPFALAAGAAGASTIIAALRPYLLIASVLFIALGFNQARRARQCRGRPHWLNLVLLWFAAVVVLVSFAFPQALANLLAG